MMMMLMIIIMIMNIQIIVAMMIACDLQQNDNEDGDILTLKARKHF